MTTDKQAEGSSIEATSERAAALPASEPAPESASVARRRFTVRCADGYVRGDTDRDELWETVEGADYSSLLWDADCDCGGPHAVLVSTATGGWEALDE